MSVPKNKRTTSEVMYFHFAYILEEKIIKYILADFGTTRSYRDLHTFVNKAKMDEKDKEVFERLVEVYHIDLESSYPEYIFDYFRSSILENCRELIDLISKAHTMYPTSVYEFNVRRQYQTDAISACYNMKHTMQIAIKIFNSNHLEKFVPLVNDIDKEIEYIKTWRKDCNKFRHGCYENDERNRINATKRVEKQIEKTREPDDSFLARILNVNKINRNQILSNTSKATFDVDNTGRLRSSIPVPAIYYMDKTNKKVINIGIG